jgi:hypothetical protein
MGGENNPITPKPTNPITREKIIFLGRCMLVTLLVISKLVSRF